MICVYCKELIESGQEFNHMDDHYKEWEGRLDDDGSPIRER